MSALSAFGDSFTELGTGASSPSLGYLPLLAEAEGFTVTNYAMSGAEAGDMATAVLGTAPGGSTNSLYFIGLNDARHFNTNSVNIAAYKSTVMAQALWLAVNNADILQASAATYHGSWGTASFGAHTAWALGDYVEFTLTGNSLYINTIQQDSSPSQEEIQIDGVSQGTFNVAPASPIATAGPVGGSPINYMPKCYHFDVGGLVTDTHTVRITKANAASYGSVNYFHSAWGNGMKANALPKLTLCGPTRCTAAGYVAAGGSIAGTLAYRQAMLEVSQQLVADGLNVRLAASDVWDDFPSAFTNGGCHPNDAGYLKLAQSIRDAMI